MSGWNQGLSVVLAGLLGAGGMLPGWAESGRVVQEIAEAIRVSQAADAKAHMALSLLASEQIYDL